MSTLSQVSHTMQQIFTTTADEDTQQNGFVRPKRKRTGSVLVQPLVLFLVKTLKL